MVCIGDNSFTVSCSCGCDNTMIVRVLDDMVFLSFAESNYYNKLSLLNIFDEVKKRIHSISCKINNKKNCLMEIIIEDKNFNTFIKALKNIKVESGSKEEKFPVKISITKEDLGTNQEIISIALYETSSIKEIITGKGYRSFEIAMNDTQWNRFVEYCEKKIC